MTRALLLVALLLIVALIPALLDHDEHEQLGSGSRVAETVPHVASPSPAEHRLVALNFELVRVVKPKVRARARTAPRRVVVAAAGSEAVNGYPCGGTLPTCHVLACESHGNPTAQNPRSSASGLWQILDSTWAGFGGFARAMFAPVDVQNAKARLLWAGGAGSSHWRSCL